MAFFAALVADDSSSLVELAQARTSDGGEGRGLGAGEDFAETLVALLDSASGEREKDVLGLVGAGAGDTELKRAGLGRTEKSLVRGSRISEANGELNLFLIAHHAP
jgi:hypothetical protein